MNLFQMQEIITKARSLLIGVGIFAALAFVSATYDAFQPDAGWTEILIAVLIVPCLISTARSVRDLKTLFHVIDNFIRRIREQEQKEAGQ